MVAYVQSPLMIRHLNIAFARSERDRLPERLLALEPAIPPYPVEVSQKLAAWRGVLADQAGDVR